MASDVKVTITLNQAAGKVGFGYPLVLAGKETVARAYTECSNLNDVVAAGFAITTNVYKAAKLIFMQDNAPSKIAVCAVTTATVDGLSAISNKGWRQLIVTSIGTDGESTVKQIADYVETLDSKMFFASISDLKDAATVAGDSRTVAFYYNLTDVVAPAAALVGATAGLKVGSFTYKNMILKGITPLALLDSDIDAVHAAKAITFVTKAGDNVTTEGKTMSGEYIDIMDSKDFVISQLTYKTQKTLNTLPKVPYDNIGIALLESVCVSVLKDAYNNGIIALGDDGKPGYAVKFALRSETSADDRAQRKYLGGTFSFSLAGAVHEATINGEIIV